MMSGVAVAAPTISNTGFMSYNKISVKDKQSCKIKTNSTLGVSSFTSQSSSTGNAKVKYNTTGGTAVSGNAANANTATTGVTVNNPASPSDCETNVAVVDGSGSQISGTGALSVNKIEVKNSNSVKVVTNNVIGVSNKTLQGSSSGNAVMYGNTTGGSATSGNATNTNTQTITLQVTN